MNHPVFPAESGEEVLWTPYRPDDWPPVRAAAGSWPVELPPAAVREFAAGLERSFQAAGWSLQIKEFQHSTLMEEGILVAPLKIRIDNQAKTCLVFPLGGSPAGAAARAAGIEAARRRHGLPPVFIYAPVPLAPDEPPASALAGFSPELFQSWTDGEIERRHLWRTPQASDVHDLFRKQNRRLAGSPCGANIERALRAMAGLEVEFLNRLAAAVAGTHPFEPFRELPAAPLLLPPVRLDYVPYLIYASRETGVLIFLGYDFKEQRDWFWRHFAAWAGAERQEIIARGITPRPEAPGLRWWEETCREVEIKEQASPLTVFISLEEPRPGAGFRPVVIQ